jgi:hypothetical protein
MRYELALAKIAACDVEDCTEQLLCVQLAVGVGQAPVVVDVGDEQGNRPTCTSSLSDRDRGGIDERVVRRELLLVEKDKRVRTRGRGNESDVARF